MTSAASTAQLLAAPAPSVSIALPVHDPELRDLERAVASVDRQVWPHRELCVVDDGSRSPEVVAFLDALARRPDVRFARHAEAGGIAAATNAALGLARGEFTLFLDHDDELADEAVAELVRVVQRHPDADLVYSDHDVVDRDGARIGLDLKPDWSPELLLAYMYVGHAKMFRTELLRSLGGLRSGFEGSADHDLLLRLAERTDRVHHVPRVLYHWRAARRSMAHHSEQKAYAFESGRRAVADAVVRRGLDARVEWADWARRARLGVYRLRFPEAQETPVTLVIAARGRPETVAECLGSLAGRTLHRDWRVVVLDRTGRLDTALPERAGVRGVVRDASGTPLATALREAVAEADSELVLLLHDDLLVVEPEWLGELLGWAAMPGVGAVGAKLVRPDGAIDHAGILLGVQGGVASAFAGRIDSVAPLEHGYYAHAPRDCAALSTACLLTRRSLLLESGGFEDKDLPDALLGVDYALRLREAGLRVVCDPYAELLHTECPPLEDELRSRALEALRRRWGARLENDPYFHPAFSRLEPHFALRTRLDEAAQYRWLQPLEPPRPEALELVEICRAQESRMQALAAGHAPASRADRLAAWARRSPLLRAIRRSPWFARAVTRLRRSRLKRPLVRGLRRLGLWR